MYVDMDTCTDMDGWTEFDSIVHVLVSALRVQIQLDVVHVLSVWPPVHHRLPQVLQTGTHNDAV